MKRIVRLNEEGVALVEAIALSIEKSSDEDLDQEHWFGVVVAAALRHLGRSKGLVVPNIDVPLVVVRTSAPPAAAESHVEARSGEVVVHVPVDLAEDWLIYNGRPGGPRRSGDHPLTLGAAGYERLDRAIGEAYRLAGAADSLVTESTPSSTGSQPGRPAGAEEVGLASGPGSESARATSFFEETRSGGGDDAG